MNPATAALDILPTFDEIVANFPAPEHAHMTSWAVSVFHKAINDGALIPGTKLSEETYAAALGISRNTLRQAFMILSAQNLVEQIPNRGVFVMAPKKEQIAELMTVRLALESAAIWQAPVGEQPQLRAVLKRAEAARLAGSASRMTMANQDFHRLLVELGGSKRLNQLMSSVLAEMRLVFFSTVTEPDFHAQYVDLNASLLQLIEQGKKAEALAFLGSYLEKTGTHFMGTL